MSDDLSFGDEGLDLGGDLSFDLGKDDVLDLESSGYIPSLTSGSWSTTPITWNLGTGGGGVYTHHGIFNFHGIQPTMTRYDYRRSRIRHLVKNCNESFSNYKETKTCLKCLILGIISFIIITRYNWGTINLNDLINPSVLECFQAVIMIFDMILIFFTALLFIGRVHEYMSEKKNNDQELRQILGQV